MMTSLLTTKFVIIALAFWGHAPACGMPTIQNADLSHVQAPSGTVEVLGVADPTTCTINIDENFIEKDFAPYGDDEVCAVEVHEWGHLVLGPVFASVNPSDPWHSPDPNSIMHSPPKVPKVCGIQPIRNIIVGSQDSKKHKHRHHHRGTSNSKGEE